MNHSTGSKLLLDEPPLCILPSLAKAVGLNEAIILQQVHYWLGENKLRGNNFVDGYYWTYNSLSAWHKQFPFFSEGTIKRAFSKLEQLGILVKAHYGNALDRRKWSRIDYDVLNDYLARSGQNDQCIGSKCADEPDQDDPTIGSKCADDLSENISEITNRVYEAHTPDEDQDLAETQDLPEQPTPVNPDRSLIEGIDLGLDPENGLGAAAAKNLGGVGAKNAMIPVVNAPVAVEKPVKVQTPSASSYCPVDINKWLQAWNESERPSKWPAMSIGMMSSQRTLDCLRQFIAHEDGDEDAAIATLINRLGNAKKDPFWKDRTVSAYFLTDPNKLFLAQFDVADPSPAPSVAPSPEPTANPNPTFFFGA